MKITPQNIADLGLTLEWKGPNALHTERYHAENVNFWRDIFPPPIRDGLMGKDTGETVSFRIAASDILPKPDPARCFTISSKQFNRSYRPGDPIEPKPGRFYPKGLLKDVTGVFPQNIEPFRCADVQNGHLLVDFNPPLTADTVQITATVGTLHPKLRERGGTSADWIETLAEWSGMQARWRGKPTDFFSGHPFERDDPETDSRFYQTPRLVQHIDDTAIQVIRQLYSRFLKPGMQALDLMSSWTSHLPGSLRLKRLAGLGMNRTELEANPLLTDRIVHDLNQNPLLPFGSESFDAAVCTVSVEYLIHPLEIFRELSRILKPGGWLIITFSNRWFPAKAIRIWKELHEFERMGLVMEYFLSTERFTDLETWSMRGLPRPASDKYAANERYSDPVYAVWGRKV